MFANRLRPPFPRRVRFYVLTGVLLSTFIQRGLAALSWENLVIERTAEAGAPSLETVFRFKNDGPSPVTIKSIQTSCGCAVASLDKDHYAPGEGGKLKVEFNTLGLFGTQEKTITVATNEDSAHPTLLTLRVTIPPLFEISPRLLWWSIGDEPTEKQIVITINPAVKTTVAEELPAGPEITTRLVRSANGRDYVLAITPVSTKTVFRAMVRLQIEPAGLARQAVTVYAQSR